MTDEDPERIAAGPDGLLKSLIAEGRKEVGTPSQLAAVAAKLGPVLGGGGPGGSGGPGASGGPAGAGAGPIQPPHLVASKAAGLGLPKILGLAVVGGATLVTVVHVLSTPDDAPIQMTETPEGPLPAGSARPTGPIYAKAPDPDPPANTGPKEWPSITPPEHEHHLDAAALPALIKAGPPKATAELPLLEEAFKSLRTDANRTIALCDEHARKFPKSQLAEERETLAIAALKSLGRLDEAQKRADAFRAAHPQSADTRRIDEILSSP